MPALRAAWRAGDLALAGLEHLAHHDVVDLLGADAAALERGLDRDAAEVHGREAGERAGELADRCASGRDDDGAGHRASQESAQPAAGVGRTAVGRRDLADGRCYPSAGPGSFRDG